MKISHDDKTNALHVLCSREEIQAMNRGEARKTEALLDSMKTLLESHHGNRVTLKVERGYIPPPATRGERLTRPNDLGWWWVRLHLGDVITAHVQLIDVDLRVFLSRGEFSCWAKEVNETQLKGSEWIKMDASPFEGGTQP